MYLFCFRIQNIRNLYVLIFVFYEIEKMDKQKIDIYVKEGCGEDFSEKSLLCKFEI